MNAPDRVDPGEVLREVLEAARAEGALEGERLVEFARALQERAGLILAGRVDELERERAWRSEAMAGLAARVQGLKDENAVLEQRALGLARENAWRRESAEGLERRAEGLERELSWRVETLTGLERSVNDLRAGLAKTEQAYGELLAHHHELLGRLAGDLEQGAQLPVLRLRELRARLLGLAEALRRDAR